QGRQRRAEWFSKEGVPMRLFSVLCCLVSLAALTSFAAPEAPRSRAVLIYKDVQLWLHIYSDGSGTVGYGAGGSFQWRVPKGTFDPDKVTKQLKALPTAEKG